MAPGGRRSTQAEIARGGTHRPRNKFTAVPDMLAAAATAPSPPLVVACSRDCFARAATFRETNHAARVRA